MAATDTITATLASLGLGINVQTLVVFCTIFLTVYYFTKSTDHRLPPGPFSLPIVGTLPFLGRDLREGLTALGKRYGDVFLVHFGSRKVVILNSFDAIREAFAKCGHAFSGRPQDFFFIEHITKGLGLVSPEGPLWREQRKFTHGVFREFGVGSTVFEDKIREEIGFFLQALREQGDKPFYIRSILQTSISNIIVNICFGNRYDYKDPMFMRYLEIMNQSFEALGAGNVLVAFPFLRHLPGDLFSYKRLCKTTDFMMEEYREQIREHRRTRDRSVTRDLIDKFLEKMDEFEDGEATTFTDEQLIHVVGDLFGAGTETLSTTLMWGLIYLLHNPEVQERVHDEIYRVLGNERLATLKDRANMPYTEATILEIQRMADIVPLSVPRTTTEDIEFQGYLLPKGVTVMPNLYSVHRDPNTWEEPYKFNPERFLDGEGKLDKKEKCIPFSMGKRVCLGETLARMELFLFFTSMLQHFRFENPPGCPLPDLNGILSITVLPAYFEVCLHERT